MDCRAEGHGTQLLGRQRLRPCRVRWPCWAAKRVAARKLRAKRQFHLTLLPHSDNMGSAWHTREEKSKKEWVLYASAIVALLLLGAIAAIVVVATGAAKKGGGGSSSGSAAVDAATPVAARSPPPPARQVAEQSTPAATPPPPASLSQASKPPPSQPTSRPPPPSPTAKSPPPPRPSPPPVVRPPPPPPTTFDPSFTAPGTTNNVPPAPGQVQAPRCCPVQLAGRTQCPLASTIHPAPPPCSIVLQGSTLWSSMLRLRGPASCAPTRTGCVAVRHLACSAAGLAHAPLRLPCCHVRPHCLPCACSQTA